MSSTLAILGGTRAVTTEPGSIFDWPLIGPEDEEAVLEVLRRGAMSGIDVTQQFESELATWFGRRFALCHNTGTAAIHSYGSFRLGIIYESAQSPLLSPGLRTWNMANLNPPHDGLSYFLR